MQVTGTTLRARIAAKNLQRDVAVQAFENSLRRFPSEDKEPVNAMERVVSLEHQIAKLQTAQQEYNLIVQVEYMAVKIPLAMAVKFIGGLGRVSKLWRGAMPVKERYGLNELAVQQAGERRQEYTLTPDTIIEWVQVWTDNAANLAAQIAMANTRQVDIQWLTEADL